MNKVKYCSEFNAPVMALKDFHFSPGAFEKLTPPWEKAEVIEAPAELANGAKAIIDTKAGPFTTRWVAVHNLTDDGFVDHQEKGPFASWTHHHRFIELADDRCELIDEIDYQLPMGKIGQLFGGTFIKRKLDRMFEYRHEITRTILEKI